MSSQDGGGPESGFHSSMERVLLAQISSKRNRFWRKESGGCRLISHG